MEKNKKKKQKWVKKRHAFIFRLLMILVVPIIKLIYGFKCKKMKIKKNEKYIVLANHQATLDPVFVGSAFNKPLYYVANDDLLHQNFKSKLLTYCFGIIGKSKGKSDFMTVKTMLQVLKENGSVCVFPEGNRTFSGELCYISPAITKFIKSAKTPVILYNIEGGYGVDPRWSLKKRKGHFVGFVKRVLSVEELASMTAEEVHQTIIDELNVQDAPSKYEYKSKQSAERIERVLYICPECNTRHQIESNGNTFTCKACGTKWEYTQNLTITKDNELYKYPTVSKWYNYQLEDIRNHDYTSDEYIFYDNNILLYASENHSPKEVIKGGEVVLFNSELHIQDLVFKLEDIEGVAASGKQQVMFRVDNTVYTIENNKELRNDFNALKYVLVINYIKSKIISDEEEFFGI